MAFIEVDGISFELKNTNFDFSFLKNYGKVFTVFDKNDSGNISFGMEDNKKRYFIKMGGAETLNKHENLKTEEVINNLISAVNVYKDLKHPLLINLLENTPIKNGYILVFDWVDGQCMNEHWTYDIHPKYTDVKSAYYRYIRLETNKLLKSLYEIFEFHKFVSSKNYVAIDFYDGSVMYDFNSGKTTICDIDLYNKTPYINEMGRLWGSSRFMSPEEFNKGDIIDEITNVYTMGAAAFVFLGGEKDKNFTKWRMGKNLYDVALKAVNPERKNRYQTINEFIENWDKALILDSEIKSCKQAEELRIIND